MKDDNLMESAKLGAIIGFCILATASTALLIFGSIYKVQAVKKLGVIFSIPVIVVGLILVCATVLIGGIWALRSIRRRLSRH